MAPSKRKSGKTTAAKPVGKRKNAEITPPKKTAKSSQTNNRYFFFQMKNGMEDAFITGAQEAACHRREYEGLIEMEKGFASAKSFKLFKQQHQDPLVNPPPKVTDTKGDPLAAADRMVAPVSYTHLTLPTTSRV